MLNISEFQKMNQLEKIAITKHGRTRMEERGISTDDVVNGINTGEIIKQYEDDKPLPSCLVLGKSCTGKMIHLVLSHDDDFIYLIKAYYPDMQIWSEDFRKRKER